MKAASHARVEPTTAHPAGGQVRLAALDADALPVEPAEGNGFLRFLRGWDNFFFKPADPTPLGLMRIVAGLLVIYVHLAYSYDLFEFCGRYAWMPLEAADRFRHEAPLLGPPMDWTPRDPRGLATRTPEEAEYKRYWEFHPDFVKFRGSFVWSAWFHITDPGWMITVHVLFLVAMVLFTIGFCTRIMAVISWLGALSYINRSPETLFGQDVMMNICLIYLMIGPSGAALSVDRLISRFWRTFRALRAGLPAPPALPPEPLVSANLALRMFQVHFCFIYLAAGTSKLLGSSWWDGTALWQIIANPEFAPLQYQFYLDFLRFLSEHRWIYEVFLTSGAMFTLMVEIGFPFLVWIRKLRWICLGAAITLHTGIAVTMGLKVFSLFMIVLLLGFVPVETIHRLLGKLFPRKPRVQLRIDGRDRRQVRLASLVRALDVGEQVEVQSASPAERGDARVQAAPAAHLTRTMQLTTEDGQVLTGYAIFKYLTRTLRLLWVIAMVTFAIGFRSGLRRLLLAK